MIDIEKKRRPWRQHSLKGVMIRRACSFSGVVRLPKVPLTTNITEQSYGGVDGDMRVHGGVLAVVFAFSKQPKPSRHCDYWLDEPVR
ncbi:hypothetical protein OK016_29050 [Vibrio chagasii]|nr:hypothetical protein [Vibrio chagasii]